MKCWSCGANLNDPTWGKVSFREHCEKCGAALHCCRNCVFYKPGLPNDCAVPETEYIADRTAMNFCEEFKLLGKGVVESGDPGRAAKRLFGDETDGTPKRDPKKRFDSLFSDDS